MSVPASPARTDAADRSATKTAALLVAAAVGVLVLLLLLGLFVTRVLAHSGLGAADARVDATLAKDRTSTLNRITHYATFLGETLTISALAAVLFLALRLTLRRWRESIFLGVSVAGEVLIFLIVTLVIHRHRPVVPKLDQAPPTSSFPSGHTAASVALYGGLAVLAWRLGISRLWRTVLVVMAVAIPLAVAFSRVYRGMHYPSDVLGGMILSTCWLAATAALLLPRSAKRGPR